MKNRMSSIYPSPLPNSPSFEDPGKKELDEEIKRVEKELDSKFSNDLTTHISQSKSFEKQKLNLVLNKLKSDNKLKLEKIESLKKQFDLIKNEIGNSNSRHQETAEKIGNLKRKIIKIESETEKHLNQSEILVEMKNTENKGLKIIKERLKKELVVMEKIDDEYERKNIHKILTKLQNKSAQFHLQGTKKVIQKNEENFVQEFTNLQNSKKETEKEIKKSIENISKANLKLRNNKSSVNKIVQSIEEFNLENEKKERKVFSSIFNLSEIRKQLKLIKEFYPDYHDFSDPLNEADINFITSSYFKLKFQEHSLSLKFQNLTGEQIDKQKKCDLVREELEKIKKNQEIQTYSSSKNLTFNEKKSLLDDQKIIEKKQVFEYTQKTILRIYLKIVNITLLAKNCLSTVAKNSKLHSDDNRVLFELDEIKSLQRHPKHVQTSGNLPKRRNTRIYERKKTYKAEPDLQEDHQINKLNLKKIKESLKKHLEKEPVIHKKEVKTLNQINTNECAQMINHDIIVCFLLEPNELDSKISENLNDNYRLILEVNKTGTETIKRKFTSLMDSLTEITHWIVEKTTNATLEISQFYQQFNAEEIEALKKEINNTQLSFKVLVKHLLENSEKFESKQKKRLSENSLPSSTKNSYHEAKPRNEPLVNDRTSSQSFNFTLGTFRSKNCKEFEDKLKSLSIRNLTQESKRIQPVFPCSSLGVSLKSPTNITRATSGF